MARIEPSLFVFKTLRAATHFADRVRGGSAYTKGNFMIEAPPDYVFTAKIVDRRASEPQHPWTVIVGLQKGTS
ncbi:MAG TPA: hypothetical protein VGY48_15800 [Vicinamibacterales bacterium]|nr:hypothetical protein [Vicinamibacterales bacterium]